MCTVTYVPLPKGFILTSSRDENLARPTLPPAIYEHGEQKIVYPKDAQAGGTWIAMGENSRVTCLLNGAFENHEKMPRYRKSRGEILLECFRHENIFTFFEEIDLTDIEPFTLLHIKDRDFHEIRWDGSRKYFKKVNGTIPHIWSSATLYDSETRDLRKKWFYDWVNGKRHSTGFDTMGFHSSSLCGNPEIDILMKRSSGLQTLSITRVVSEDNRCSLQYKDVLKQEECRIQLRHDQEPA